MEVVTGNITIKHILQHNNNWQRFYNKHKHRIRDSVVENINKLLLCRTQELGFHRYQCHSCGDIVTVPHSCKSRFCSSCGKLATDRWMLSSISSFPNVSYQHLVLTVPEELRDLILLNRQLMLNALFRLAGSCLSSWCSLKKSYIPGITMILHTFGRDLKFNPHIHMLLTCGGLSLDYRKWINNFFIPHKAIKPMRRYEVISFIRTCAKKQEIILPKTVETDLSAFLKRLYSKIWYVNLGIKLPDAKFTITYIGRYAKRPVIAESRILEYDGRFMLFFYKDQISSKTLYVRLTVDEFIVRLIRHIPDKGFRQIRHAGIFALRVRSRLIPLTNNMLENMRKSVNIFIGKLREYFFQAPYCPRCGCETILVGISHNGKYTHISEAYTSHPP